MKHFSPRFSLFLVLLASQLAYPQKFLVFDAPGATDTTPTDASITGKIVGHFGTPDGQRHGFERSASGKFITFDATASAATYTGETNSRGEIVGSFVLPPVYWVSHAFVRDAKGHTELFSFPGTLTQTFPSALNSVGLIVGGWIEYADDGQHTQSHGFLRNLDGTLTSIDLGDPYYPETWINAVNSVGQTVGFCDGYNIGTNEAHAFIRDADGTITRFDVLNATNTIPVGINTDGVVAGNYLIPGVTVQGGFIRDAAGQITTFSVPNATISGITVVGIDSKGRLAGMFRDDAANQIHGFIRRTDGTIQTFDAPGAVSTIVSNINTHGDIVGQFNDANGKIHGFLLSQ